MVPWEAHMRDLPWAWWLPPPAGAPAILPPKARSLRRVPNTTTTAARLTGHLLPPWLWTSRGSHAQDAGTAISWDKDTLGVKTWPDSMR